MATYVYGALPPKKDIREYKAKQTAYAQLIDIPEEFELEMPMVKNQKDVSSCVAFAISTVIEYYNKLQEETTIPFSTGYIYGNRQNSFNKGQGMYVDDAINAVVKWGDVPNSKFDYNIEVPEAITKFEEKAFDLAPEAYPHRFSSFFRLDTDEARKLNLLQNGPIVFSIPWFADYYVEANTYIMRHEDTRIAGHHAMVIYGWNKDGWKIQNSWGLYFGNKGRAILPYGTEFATCFGIKDDISERIHNEQLKKLEDQITQLSLEISGNQTKIADLTAKLLQAQAEQDRKQKQLDKARSDLELLQAAYDNAVKEYGPMHDTVLAYGIAIRRKTAEVDYLNNNLIGVLQQITDLNGQMLDLSTETTKLNKKISEQNSQIVLLEQELLNVKKPFEKMPTWLAHIINAIINIFK